MGSGSRMTPSPLRLLPSRSFPFSRSGRYPLPAGQLPPQAVSSKCFSFGHHNKKSGNTSSISGFFMEIGRMRAAQSLPSPCSERPLGGGAPAPGTDFRFPPDPASSFSAQSCRGRQGFPLPFSFAFHGPRRSGRRSWSSPSATRNCPSGSSDSSP